VICAFPEIKYRAHMGAEQKRMEANQDCTILWYQDSMLGFEMTK